MAFISATLFALLFALAVCGITLAIAAALDQATRDAGRQMQIGNLRDATGSAARTRICASMGFASSSCAANLKTYATSGSSFATLTEATVTQTTMSPTTFTPGVTGSAVLLQAAYPIPIPIPFTNMSNFMLTSAAVFRNEQ